MVRHYKNKYNAQGKLAKHSPETKKAVLEALKTKSQRAVSKQFNISKSTVFFWAKNPNKNVGAGTCTYLEPKEEELLVEALLYTAKCGFPQSRNNLKDMVQSYVLSSGKTTPFTNGRPGEDWTFRFEKRHKAVLRRRKREGLSIVRAKGLSKENIASFYEIYKAALIEHDIENKPWVIFNVDETGLTADKISTKVYVGADVKNAYSVQPAGTKTMYTVLVCTNAIGQYLPPYTIYKAKNIYDRWCYGGVEGAAYGVSDSGWMFDKNFESWFKDVFLPRSKDIASTHHRLLLYDGHNSHLTYNTVKCAMENGVTILCLPPNTSHAFQPLDVGVFRAFKAIYADECEKWFRNSRHKAIDKPAFPALLKKVWERLDPQHVVSGFRKCGLYPYNPHALDDKIIQTPKDALGPVLRPRNPVNLLKKAICEVLQPAETPETRATLENKARERTRVQSVAGEVLTVPTVRDRLLAEQEKRGKKKKAPAKASSSGISINFRPTAKSINSKPQKKATGTLDTFVIRKKNNSEKSKSTVKQKNLNDFFPKKNKGIYKEVSSTDSDPDDPGVATLPQKKDKNYQAGVSHVIYEYEGSYFPGLVTELKKKAVVINTMQKSGLKTWRWPEQVDEHTCQVNDIVHSIPPPVLVNNRGNNYFVEKIGDYW